MDSTCVMCAKYTHSRKVRKLRCGHTLCLACVFELCRCSTSNSRCPKCHCSFPANDFAALSKNFNVNHGQNTEGINPQMMTLATKPTRPPPPYNQVVTYKNEYHYSNIAGTHYNSPSNNIPPYGNHGNVAVSYKRDLPVSDLSSPPTRRSESYSLTDVSYISHNRHLPGMPAVVYTADRSSQISTGTTNMATATTGSNNATNVTSNNQHALTTESSLPPTPVNSSMAQATGSTSPATKSDNAADKIVSLPENEQQNLEFEIVQKRGLASIYMNNKNYEEALTILKDLESDHGDNIIDKLAIIQCYLSSKQENQALLSCRDLLTSELKPNSDNCEPILVQLPTIYKSLPKTEFLMCISLLRYGQHISNYLPDPKTRILKLQSLASSMQPIASSMTSHKDDIKRYCLPFIGEIRFVIKQVPKVDVRFRVEQECWCLKYYAFCCNLTDDHTRSMGASKEAILLLTTTFGKDSSKLRILGYSYHNLGSSLKSLKRYKEARDELINATYTHNRTTDFKSDAERHKSKTLTSQCLESVKYLISLE